MAMRCSVAIEVVAIAKKEPVAVRRPLKEIPKSKEADGEGLVRITLF